MKKIAVIYWSGTGNTEMMAKAVAEGAQGDNNEVKLLSVDKASVEDVMNADGVALGCPSMGAEVLEESEMEPFVQSLEKVVTGKPLVLFGSYDWGDGEWMRDWEERMKGYGANLIAEGLIVNLEPADQNLDACKKLGARLL
ncbi:flavodoxin [Geosporobacter ferrireducens]|uniref:Flavodoxin n=1 Tax=Geosporobacter ferrireducens TaxID=1424294 RepID=A0A1D8GFF6_9FIRM|nr:flavodoxin [Geosporobacter ferrireducens]AOT69622.1 flavodoxin [Geosporobacter ferrireducens]MTI54676.1 flavodoxin [Geosporobacter ferrireducens]